MEPTTIIKHPPAKVNLYLEVLDKRPDGYHNLRTVMQTITLFDTLALAPSDEVQLTTSGLHLETGDGNLCIKAARLLQDTYKVKEGVSMHLEKKIPIGAGLGGGSSDAAHTLTGLTELWRLDASRNELAELAERLGADVPFFLYGGTCLCEGKGERVRPLEAEKVFHYVIVIPDFSVSTKEVYKNFKKNLTSAKNNYKFANVLSGSTDYLHNNLTETVFELHPQLRSICSFLEKETHTKWHLTGSGSALYTVCYEKEDANTIANVVDDSGKWVTRVACSYASTGRAHHG